MSSKVAIEQSISKRLEAQAERHPFMEGFDTVFDMHYFGHDEGSLSKNVRLSQLGVLSPSHLMSAIQNIDHYSITSIKREQGYIGQTDAIKFAQGARAAYVVLGGYDNV